MRKFWIAIVVLFVLDQVTKWLAQQWLQMYTPVPILPSLNLTLIYNEGAAFGMLSDAGGWQRWFFIVTTVIICAVLITWLQRLQSDDLLSKSGVLASGIALILAGAFGNLLDRIVYGHVVDFFDVYYGQFHWPIFNIADICVTLGAVLVIWDTFTGIEKMPERSE